MVVQLNKRLYKGTMQWGVIFPPVFRLEIDKLNVKNILGSTWWNSLPANICSWSNCIMGIVSGAFGLNVQHSIGWLPFLNAINYIIIIKSSVHGRTEWYQLGSLWIHILAGTQFYCLINDTWNSNRGASVLYIPTHACLNKRKAAGFLSYLAEPMKTVEGAAHWTEPLGIFVGKRNGNRNMAETRGCH